MNARHVPKFHFAPVLPVDRIKPKRQPRMRATWGELLCIPVIVAIALIGGWLMGWPV